MTRKITSLEAYSAVEIVASVDGRSRSENYDLTRSEGRSHTIVRYVGEHWYTNTACVTPEVSGARSGLESCHYDNLKTDVSVYARIR